ncbi:fungal specific transcription factor domain-containing protein [Aspergillus foveolatus]|uniref:fungal specific transcription factor domain-containing protein n=1 Tax=Aspergillus foveolatus TaxID=210207 RepID=UPI003CCD8FA9
MPIEQLRSDMEGLSILPQEKGTYTGPRNVYLPRDWINTSRSNATARILATTASPASRYAASFEERCQHMDNLCERLEGLAKTLSDCIAITKINGRQDVPTSPRSSASVTNPIQPARHTMERTAMPQDPVIDIPEIGEIPDTSPGFRLGAVSESSGNMQDHDTQTYPTPVDAVGVYSSPRLLDGDLTDIISWRRYIGGATNKLMIEAVQRLSPGGSSKPAPSKDNEGNEISLPFFIQGQVWPELPYLPQPQDLSRPPQYVSDLLVGIYFDQLHYTFPILYKPDFMRRYQLMNAANGARRHTVVGRGFLSVFFAVCACASSLLPRASGSSSLPGIEYYQKALLLHFASSGEKRVSLGTPKITEYVETQVARGTWWSVFTLDCLMSTCLGRPMATDEADCCCELPFDISNEDLEHGIPPPPAELEDPSDLPLPYSPMTGFLAFTRLCRIASRIHRFYNTNRIRGRDVTLITGEDWSALLPTLNGFVRELDEWLQELPNEIRFSANLTQSGPILTIPLAAYYSEGQTRATSLSNFRNFSPTLANPSAECINAARSCIQAAELIRERVAPSHYLAFCVQYLTISGIMLLSMADDDTSPTLLPDVENALRFLGDLEAIWPGASRSRLILDRLLQSPRPQPRARGSMGRGMSNEGEGENVDRHGQEPDVYGGTGAGGWYPSLPVLDELLWEQFPDSGEVFLGLSNFPN